MDKKFWLFIVLLLTSALMGCNLPAEGVQGPPVPGTLCKPDQLVAPVASFPVNGEVVPNLTPTFQWKTNDPTLYPLDTLPNCIPLNFHVQLLKGPAFQQDQLENTAALAGYSQNSLTFANALQPATEYAWSVTGFAGTTSGIVDGPPSAERHFFTGPSCNDTTPFTVDLDPTAPANGSQVNTLLPDLMWTYPIGCLAEEYLVDLSTDPGFAGTNLGGSTGLPGEHWTPKSNLVDCTWYYWRVKARLEYTSTPPYPESQPQSFFVNVTGGCQVPETATVTPGGPTPTRAPTRAPTLTPTAPPNSLAKAFTTSINANCRVGPSQLYPIVTSYFAGQMLIMDGRNDDTSWLHVGQDRCWVSIITGIYNGDPTQLPVMEAPPVPDTPTSIPTKVPKPTKVPNSCSDLKTQQSCTLDPSCSWTKLGTCINK